MEPPEFEALEVADEEVAAAKMQRAGVPAEIVRQRNNVPGTGKVGKMHAQAG
jgi:hypothetical protein